HRPDRDRHQQGGVVDPYAERDRQVGEAHQLHVPPVRLVEADQQRHRQQQRGRGPGDGQAGRQPAARQRHQQTGQGGGERHRRQQHRRAHATASPLATRPGTAGTPSPSTVPGTPSATSTSAGSDSGTVSTATEARNRNSCSTIARPTPSSAAAITMTNRAKTWPVYGVPTAASAARTVVAAVTRMRLTALSISSTAMSSRMAWRRRNTPNAPMPNSAAAT